MNRFSVICIFNVLYFIILVNCDIDPKCKNTVCPEQRECRYPKITVDLPDPHNKCCNITECICEGTTERLSSSHNPKTQYDGIKHRYTNCTWVDGNLEIVYVDKFDEVLTATQHIHVVTGYVLIATNSITYIDLSSIQLIRGDKLYHDERKRSDSCGDGHGDTSAGYALFITNNYPPNPADKGLIEIRMPVLTEIMKGDVKIDDNRDLCYIDTIVWKDEILNTKLQSANVTMSNVSSCSKCPDSCNTDLDNKLHCWGNSTELCQKFTKLPCKDHCTGRCNLNRQCCNSYCAAGCTVVDPSSGLERTCHACKELNNFGECVQKCPSRSINNGEVPEIDETNVRYQLTWYCVPKCPSTRRTWESSCVLTCPADFYEKNGYCEKCSPGGCNHICHALEAGIGPLKYDDVIHANNIGNFHKNCTIIEGSLNFRKSTFEGDSHCGIPPITEQAAFEVFQNVEEITGYLDIEHWPYEDLCIFKNLKRIRGYKVKYMTYSLLVLTDKKNLRELCFNSLEEIQAGQIIVSYNRGLCFADNVNWPLFFAQPYQDLVVTKNSKSKKCVPCSDQCKKENGCWGPNDDQCITCRNFTDYTNADGKFVEKWVINKESGEITPGNNVTTCLSECDFEKGTYATEDKKCFPCQQECNSTCTGEGPGNCSFIDAAGAWNHGCKHVYNNGICIPECPIGYYPNGSSFCMPCNVGCVDGRCTGPDAIYGNNGCSLCYREVDEETDQIVYRGAQCEVCLEHLKDSSCALGCVEDIETNTFKCYVEPSSTYIIWIVVICVIIVLASSILIILFKCRKTIRSMQQHIEDKIVGDTGQADEFNTTITPSGTAPNRAQLRIVKDTELAIGKTLGAGAFGAVYKAVWTSMHIEGQNIKIPVAVKKLKTFSHSNEIMDEAYVMASVDSPYLVRLLGICMTQQVSLITQLMPLGNLLEYVRDNCDNIGSRHMLTWCTQITKGMQYLEEKHLVHRDLAARNVLIKTPHHVKITDFGLAKMLNADQSVYFAEGGKLPIKWLAIECITERIFSHQSDVWAFGVTCWEIFTFGSRPYEGIRAVDVLCLLEKGERLTQPPICTIDVYMILIKCWMVDPQSRPKFSELIEDFSKMCHDHSRYIVIKDDPNHGLLSPNPEEERRFFERLMKEENGNVDDDILVDEPDNYLLPRNTLNEPEYKNLPIAEQLEGIQGVNEGAGSSSQAARDNRLFSRNTPSACPLPISCNSEAFPNTHETARMNQNVVDSSNTDDVFASTSNGTHGTSGLLKSLTVDLPGPEKGEDGSVRYCPDPGNGGAGWSTGRKYSEENPRYTEDPTLHKSSYFDESLSVEPEIVKGQLLYDEDQYLLPTPSKRKPDYFDPMKNCSRKPERQAAMPASHPSATNEFQGLLYNKNGNISPTNRTPIPKVQQSKEAISSLEPEYINTQVQEQEHEYLNCGTDEIDTLSDNLMKQDDCKGIGTKGSSVISPSNTGTFFNNDEYMTTDSVTVGNNGNSVFVDGTAPSSTRHRSFFNSSGDSSSNGSLGPLISTSPLHERNLSDDEHQLNMQNSAAVQYKPNPKSQRNGKKTQKNSDASVSIDNPEYMMLQESIEESNKLLPYSSKI